MKILVVLVGLLGSLAAFAEECDAPAPIGEMVPFQGQTAIEGAREQAIGFYSDGSLRDADAVPGSGFGFIKIFRPRDRAWVTTPTRNVFEQVASELFKMFPARDALQVGDTSARNGGPISGHASHQNGLDTDIGYLRVDQTTQDPMALDGFEVKFVDETGRVAANFDRERNWAFVKLMAATGRVDRFFVNPGIKAEFCRVARAKGEFSEDSLPLRLLRPWKGHDGHIHVRYRCPEGVALCRAQEPLPPGAGC